MARRKHRKHHSRRRRVGATKSGIKGMLTEVAGIAGGVFVGRMATTKLATTVSPRISNLILIAAGLYVPKFLKSPIGDGLGKGLIAVGTLGELQAFGVVSGIGAMAPGTAATSITSNQYNPAKMRVVGAPRPSLNNAVNGLGKINVNRLGALMEER